ncbi:CynX/NimT family MFS transporter [Leekyejoonella antrihumi]|uniref:MFS transporter n=1 Tax=Leekyejoonella antrihumi TaxID=1660198 RepID=A0A563DTI4_9MICO|nr:MFS transporter [Leekyejoonella antrihumi]TWP33241.1 MFS transporter [Leekyejoonella antrihumi]
MTGEQAASEHTRPVPPRRRAGLLLVAMLLLAANLRTPLTEVGPVLSTLRGQFGLTSGAASLLTALPILLFGLCAPLASPALRRMGIDRLILLALVVLLAAGLLRLAPSLPALLVGTTVMGAAIAIGNVVLPVLVKTRFPDRAGVVTGSYTMALNVGASAAAGTIVPLTAALGSWRAGFSVWLIPIVAACCCWAPLVRARNRAGSTSQQMTAPTRSLAMLGNARVLAIVIFTASQSVVYYGMITWLPSIFSDHGASPSQAGALLSVATFIGAPVALVLPPMAARARDQRPFVVALVILAAAGLCGLLIAPTAAPYLWAVLLGIGQGGIFPLALIMYVLRTSNGEQTAALSVLAQATAYVFAAFGPLIMGVLRDRSGTWSSSILLLLACLVVELVTGLSAGRAGHIHLTPPVDPGRPSPPAAIGPIPTARPCGHPDPPTYDGDNP